MKHGSHSLRSFDYYGGKILFEAGFWDANEGKAFQNLVQEGMTVVDVGAHMGYYTLIAARAVGNSGRVYAFEPSPSNYSILLRNIRRNQYTNVTAIRKAVSNVNGQTNFIISETSDESSLIESTVKSKKGSISVDLVTLDHFFEVEKTNVRPDIIKIDAEGADGMVVEGAINVLRKCVEAIVIEICPKLLTKAGTDPLELLSKLRSIGFKSEKVILVRHSSSKWSADQPLEDQIRNLKKGFMNLLLQKR